MQKIVVKSGQRRNAAFLTFRVYSAAEGEIIPHSLMNRIWMTVPGGLDPGSGSLGPVLEFIT
jgi:hypothetical protein